MGLAISKSPSDSNQVGDAKVDFSSAKILRAIWARYTCSRGHRQDRRGTTRCMLCSTSFSEKCNGAHEPEGFNVMRMHLKTG